MTSLEKLKVLTPFQKLPKNLGDLGKLIVAKGYEKLPKRPINRPIWSHCLFDPSPLDTKINHPLQGIEPKVTTMKISCESWCLKQAAYLGITFRYTFRYE